MKDVNFIDSNRVVEKKPSNSKLNVIVPFLIIILILILGGIYFSFNFMTKQSNNKINEVNVKIKKYSEVIVVKKNIEDYNTKITSMSEVIRTISADSFINTKLMQNISSVMPSDVFLLNYSVSKLGQISIEASSKTNESIAYFARKLKETGMFQSAEVKSISNNASVGDPNYGFVIDVKIKY